MSDVTRILSAIEQGGVQAADQLLPLVYDELRQLAAQRLAREKPGQTLEATALVHEAYLRLVTAAKPAAKTAAAKAAAAKPAQADAEAREWKSRGHFFAAAAEAMRRILVEQARAKRRIKRGGGAHRVELDEHFLIADDRVDELLGVNDALEELEQPTPFLPPLIRCNLTMDGGAGNDVLDAVFSADTKQKVAELNVALFGGDGADMLRLLWTPGAFEALAFADGGAGLDTGLFSPGVRHVNVESVG